MFFTTFVHMVERNFDSKVKTMQIDDRKEFTFLHQNLILLALFVEKVPTYIRAK